MRSIQRILLSGVIIFTIALAVVATPGSKALAATDAITIYKGGGHPSNGVLSSNCGDAYGYVEVNVDTHVFFTGGDSYIWTLTDVTHGTTLSVRSNTFGAFNSDYVWPFYAYTVLAHGTLIQASFSVTYGGTTTTDTTGPFDCNGGLPPPPPPANDPHVPSNFIQRQMSCTTGLYWAADPKATVNGTYKITAGQVFYVSQTAVKGTDGNQWTPVYVGGFDIVYVPTSCAFQTQAVAVGTPPPSRAGTGGYAPPVNIFG